MFVQITELLQATIYCHFFASLLVNILSVLAPLCTQICEDKNHKIVIKLLSLTKPLHDKLNYILNRLKLQVKG